MTFFSNCWKYLSLIFFGVIAGLVYAMKQLKPSINTVNAESYIAMQNHQIGKLKQRGEGNTQNLPPLPAISGRKEIRKLRCAARRERRLQKATETKEQASEDN
ncbi:MAG TPA: hypothetical protein DHV48_10590 [Prolixibacteraceae bacterium]|nr:hypothetical protein [Prolixibacteraceae bacterium]